MELPVKTPEREPEIQINELFGPTYQGEGPDIGKPCLFVRLHNCPVQCPGCDTHFTWDGSEKGSRTPLAVIESFVKEAGLTYPGIGVVLSGGEPLIHYRNEALRDLVWSLRRQGHWVSLETSGFIGKETTSHWSELAIFVSAFSQVALSPKITPCLHGQFPDEQLLANYPRLVETALLRPNRFFFKFVVKDEADLEVVKRFEEVYLPKSLPTLKPRIYLMPYGIHPEEIIRTCDWLVPYVAKGEYILTPRLHTLLWGNKRGV